MKTMMIMMTKKMMTIENHDDDNDDDYDNIDNDHGTNTISIGWLQT